MSAKKYRQKSEKELRKEIEKSRQDLSDILFNIRIGKVKDYSQARLEKKKIATMLTVLHEKSRKGKKKVTKQKVQTKVTKKTKLNKDAKNEKKSK